MTKKAFFDLAAAHGIEVDYTPGGVGRGFDKTAYPYHIMLDAPAGKIFSSTGLHCDGSIQGSEGTTKTDWKEAVSNLKELIAGGIEACQDPDCDVCLSNDD